MGEDFSNGREDSTQTRIRIQTEKEIWTHEVWKRLLILAGVFGTLATLAGAIAFIVGRASAADLGATDSRVIRVEQATVDHQREHVEMERTIGEDRQRTAKKFDSIDVKLDRLFEQSVATAHRVGARELPAPPKHKESAP